MIPRLPRSKNPDQEFVLRGRVWDQLAELVEYSARLDVAQPLWIDESPGGATIGITPSAVADALPKPQYPGMALVSKADLTWSAGFYPLHEMNEGV